MNMSNISALNTQFFLNILIQDELSCSFLLSNDNPNAWQFAVELIYRLKTCDLIDFSFDVLNKSLSSPDTTYSGLDDFCYHLSKTNPSSDSNIWFDAQLSLTKKGQTLMSYYFKDFTNWDKEINIPFIDKLEEIFHNYNVPWDEDRPIFPIKGTAQNSDHIGR